MKKKLVAAACLLMTLCVSGCSLTTGSKVWQDSDFDLKKGEEDSLTLSSNTGIMIYEDAAYTFKFDEEEYDEYDDVIAMARGLKVGDGFEEFLNEYNVSKSTAAWEIVGEDNTKILPYNKETPQEIYKEYSEDEYNNWLDIGFYQKGNSWKSLSATDLAKVWFCETDAYEGKDIAVLSVNVDENGEIICISLYHFVYGNDWIEWQAWED